MLGHETMGIVEEIGAGVTQVRVGDRVVDPVQHRLRQLLHVRARLHSQCETTQVARVRHRRRALRLHRALRRRSPAARPSASGCPSPTSTPDHRPDLPDDALPVPLRHPADRLAGRSSTRRCRTAAPSPCSASVRSASSPSASVSTAAHRVIAVDPGPRAAGAWRSGTASRRSTSTDDIADVISRS